MPTYYVREFFVKGSGDPWRERLVNNGGSSRSSPPYIEVYEDPV